MTPTPIPFECASRPDRASFVARLTALVILILAPRLLSAQAFTLPTIRLGEPPIEEREFFRIMRELRSILAPDSSLLGSGAADSALRAVARQRSARFQEKLDSLTLAALDSRQITGLVRARSRPDTLLLLASDKYDTTETEVRLLSEALDRFAEKLRKREKGGPTLALIRERDARRLLRGARRLEELTAVQHARVDTLSRLAVALIIYRKLGDRVWFPVHSRPQAEVFWGQRGIAPLNVGAVSAGPTGGVAYTELASPILQFLRMSVSAVIAQGGKESESGTGGSTDAQKGALQQFLAGGGLVNLSAAYPIFHGPYSARETAVSLLLVPRLGFTSPALGTTKDSTLLALDTGVELHGKLLDLVGGVGLTGQVRFGVAVGSSGWGDALGLPRDRLSYGTVGFGFAFARQYQFTFSRLLMGPRSMRQAGWTVGLSAVRLPDA